MSPTIIAISGKMKSGKDELAKSLISNFQYEKMLFADKLKKAVAIIHGWNYSDLEDQEFKARIDPFWGYTPRQALQIFGSETMKRAYPKYMNKLLKRDCGLKNRTWTKCLEKDIANSPFTKIVITDMRFKSEMESLLNMRARGYKVVLIRINASYKKFASTVSKNPIIRFFELLVEKQHISEYDLDYEDRWDFVIENDSTIEEYQKKIKEVALKIHRGC